MIAPNPTLKPGFSPAPGQNDRGAVSPERWLALQTHRYAVKKYDPSRKIDDTLWDALEESLVLAPSGIGLQPWKFLVVDDPAVRERLREASYGQPQITDAAKLVVLAARVGYSEADVDRFIARVAEVRGTPAEALAGLRQSAMNVANMPEADRDAWTASQAHIALGYFVSAAAALGVDATPMQGFEAAKYDAILGLREKGYRAVLVAAAGYRSPEDKYATLPKVRFRREDVVERV